MRTARLAAFAALLALLSRAGVASAQDVADTAPPTASPAAPQGTEQALVSRYWELGTPRWFLGTTLEAGYAYAKPRFVLGYGLPYWRWFGVETYPIVALSGVGHYLGIGGALPGVTARIGARYTYPFNRSLLTPQDSFDWTELDNETGPKADYVAIESELTGTVPAPGGSAFTVLNLYRVELVEEGYYVFEESLRVIVDPPYIWRARLGYLLAFGRDGAIRIGVAGDVIGVPDRDEYVVRGGLLGSVSMTAQLEAQASFIPVLVSPDSIGLAGGDFGQLGVRFRWATGSKPKAQRLREVFTEPPPLPTERRP